MPHIVEVITATDNEWYPVEWDISRFKGETVVIEVVDGDDAGGISVDHFEQFNDQYAFLPSCMQILPGVCPDDKDATCFFFEGDPTAYKRVKATIVSSGTYCRDVPMGDAGSKVGEMVAKMGSTGDRKSVV